MRFLDTGSTIINLRVYRYLLTDIGRSAICTVKLTPDDKIASLQMVEL
jgi:hypothetical protein